MYVKCSPRRQGARFFSACVALAAVGFVYASRNASAQVASSVVRNISQATERLEMTVNTSQILTLGARIPRLVVNNPELVTATPVSETQVQIAARKPGVTQINLWDEKGQIYTVDLLIFGDVRELEVNLKRMFPASSLRVIRLTNSLVLEGQVDRPEIVSTIRTLAEDYAPKVINNITVGGAQQVLLKVKVMEADRNKLRNAGFDFAQTSSNSFFSVAAGGLLTNNAQIGSRAGVSSVQFGVADGNNRFFGFLQALEQRQLIKTLADPVIVTLSGRPATFNSGGEIFFQISNGVSGTTVQSEKFGTQVDFLPIVLGNGRIRLEVRPKISDIDNSAQLGNELFRTRLSEVDTGVEMNAGQTLALAGLIQTKVTNQVRGIPYLMNAPYVGAAFRTTRVNEAEVELLILVTPEFAEAMDPCEVPPCGPGMETMSPSDCDVYFKGKIEVPSCGPCGASQPCYCNAPGLACGANGCGSCQGFGAPITVTDGDGAPINSMPAPVPQSPTFPTPQEPQLVPAPANGAVPAQPLPAPTQPALPNVSDSNRSSSVLRPQWMTASARPSNPSSRQDPTPALVPANRGTSTPGLIGPIGYDVQK
jgi:pilus assembly protein CpaC